MNKAQEPPGRPLKKVRIDVTAKKQQRTRFSQLDSTISNSSQVVAEAAAVAAPKNKGKARETSPVDVQIGEEGLPSTFKIVTGSYEKLLYGVEGNTSYSDDDGLQFHLKPIFAFPAHVSCIKAVAASPYGGKWLATGSADEIIKVWDLRGRKEIGGLMHHQGSITHLVFPSRSHLLSASEDGTLCLFRARDWTVLRTLKGHRGRVNAISVHPSGKVALSVGKDRALRMWDLMRGRGVASTKLGKEGELVRWSVDGKLFVVQSGSTIDIYNTEMTLLYTLQHPSRVHDVKFCERVVGEGQVLLVGAEDKKLSIYDIPKDSSQPPIVIAQMIGPENRVKAVQTLRIALPSLSDRASTTIISTVSSDGKIRLYDMYSVPVTSKQAVDISPLAEFDTKGTRLTCVTLADGDVGAHDSTSRKRKIGSDDDAESNPDSDSEAEGNEWEPQEEAENEDD